jgi:hypothetical protein
MVTVMSGSQQGRRLSRQLSRISRSFISFFLLLLSASYFLTDISTTTRCFALSASIDLSTDTDVDVDATSGRIDHDALPTVNDDGDVTIPGEVQPVCNPEKMIHIHFTFGSDDRIFILNHCEALYPKWVYITAHLYCLNTKIIKSSADCHFILYKEYLEVVTSAGLIPRRYLNMTEPMPRY